MSIGKKKEITIATCDGETIIVCDDARVRRCSHDILVVMVTMVESKWLTKV